MALYREVRGRGVELVGVGLRENAGEVRKFAKEFGIEFPLWLDPEGQSPAAFGLWGHPTTVLLDREGRVVGRLRGERDWSTPDARRLVEALLAAGAAGTSPPGTPRRATGQ